MRDYKKYVLLLLVLISYGRVSAIQTLEQVHLKDGSVIEGYISEQIPGKTIKVKANQAILIVDSDSLISSSEKTVPVSSLSSEWKGWVMEQNVTPEALKLSTLKFPNSEFKDVNVLVDGEEIKFLSLELKEYSVDWTKVDKTVKSSRPEDQFSGLDDVLVMKDGSRYTGQVSEQCLGRNIKIKLSKDNTITVNSSQVVEMSVEPVSEELTIIEQTPLLDRIYVKGKKEPVVGVILRRRTSKDLTILSPEEGELTYSLRDITKYQKVPNANYRVLTDKSLNPGEILLNGEAKNAWFANLETINGYLVLGEEVSMIANKGDELLLEAKLENPLAAINLIKAYRKDISDPNSKEPLVRDVFTYQDLVELALPLDRTFTPTGNTKVLFKLQEPGDYVLSIQGQKGFIIIHVD